METNKFGMLGIFFGVIAGGLTVSWWKKSNMPQDSKTVDTGQKTSDGKSILEVTGVGGSDSGVKVNGYALPTKIDDIKLPVTVIVRPNQNLFLNFKAGEKVTFVKKRNDELIWIGKIGDASGEYVEWYPNLTKKVLGAI